MFVDAFLEDSAVDNRHLAESYWYDEVRQISVTASGSPVVEERWASETVTGTKAGGESEDSDEDREPQTMTFVHSEGYDPAPMLLGTKTGVKGEAEDYWPDALL